MKGEELKSYGDQLTVPRSRSWRQLIWQQAGEEFNINSPKQLGVVLFEKMGITGGKEDQNRLFHSRRCVWRSWHRQQPIIKRYPGIQAAGKAEVHLCRRSCRCDRIRMAESILPLTRPLLQPAGSAAQSRIFRIFRYVWNWDD